MSAKMPPTPPKVEIPPTPELDKMSKVSEESQSIGAFLDWASWEKKATLMAWVERDTEETCPGDLWHGCKGGKEVRDADGEEYVSSYDCRRCKGTGTETHHFEGYEAVSHSIEGILAEYFDIDLNKVEAERRAILASLAGGQS